MARKTTGKKPAANPDASAPDNTDAAKAVPATEPVEGQGQDLVSAASVTPEPASSSKTDGAESAPVAEDTPALPVPGDDKTTPEDAPIEAVSTSDPASEAAETPPSPVSEADIAMPERAQDNAASTVDAEPDPQDASRSEVATPAASLADPGPFSTAIAEDADTKDAATASSTLIPDPGAPVPPVAAAPPPPAAAPAKSGFFPLLLGGLVAGGIGYGAHFYLSQQDAPQGIDPVAIAALQAEVASLRADLEARPVSEEVAPPDLSAIEAELAELRSALVAQPDEAGAEVGALIEAEIAALRDELGDAGESVDLVPLLGQLDTLSASVADAQAQVADLGSEVAALRNLAENRVTEAEAAVDTALARAGVEMMRSALDLGAPYPEAIALMRDASVSVPETLASNAQTGVPTLETLQERFPASARAALREALQDAPSDSTTERLGNFLRAQVGARSTAPRAGDDPDAVLSRAGAAVEAGDLDTALTEMEALPEPAQAAMSEWTSDARLRRDVDAALPEFIATYSSEQGSL